jgi:hypothetical protein
MVESQSKYPLVRKNQRAIQNEDPDFWALSCVDECFFA